MKHKFIERRDEAFYQIADGVKMVTCAALIMFCAAIFIGSLILTDAEAVALREMIFGG